MARAWRNKNLNNRRKVALANLKNQPPKKDTTKQKVVDTQIQTLERQIKN